jgi:hypothetical protein
MDSEPAGIASWHRCLPPADAAVPCGTGTHTVRWEAGQLTLPAHPDAEAELVLGALGGDKPGCVTLAETWAGHASDLAVLAIGPRGAADQVTVSREDVAKLRAGPSGAGLAAGLGAGLGAAFTQPFLPGRGSSGAIAATPSPGPAPARRVARVVAARRLPHGHPMAELVRGELRRAELLELLALGPAFQFRLAGAVASAWADASQAEARARRRPELTAALAGRLGPAAREWLGIDPDAVTVTPHEGPGWGRLEVTGTGPARRLRAALPVSWLSAVWACGLAVAGGHLVVAVEQPGYPRARVLALDAPDTDPVLLDVQASASDRGVPAWQG